MATASARQDQATLKQLQLRLKLRQVEARHDVVAEGFEFAMKGGSITQKLKMRYRWIEGYLRLVFY